MTITSERPVEQVLPVAPGRRRQAVVWLVAVGLVTAGALALSSRGASTSSTRLGAALPSEAAGVAGAPDKAAAAPQAAASQAEGPAADSSRIVKTGTVVLRAARGRVGTTLAAVEQAAAQVRGYVSSSSTQETGSSPTGTVTLRVPVASYEDVLRRVRGLGATVVSVSSTGDDVTATYADTQAQITSLTAARARFLVILGQARTIGETLSVQQRVDEVQQQIDRLEGQRRVLADQSDRASLTVTVGEKGDLPVEPVSRSGLAQAWHDAVQGFTSGLEGLLARSGRALVVLLVLAVLVGVGRLGWRFLRPATR